MQLAFKTLGSGSPLIILHGLYGNSDNWITIAKSLAENFKVFLIDLRNHGQSPHSNEHNYDVLQQDVVEFFESQNIEKAIVIGHSMGGKTAMLFALRNPGKVESLIIVDIAPKSYKGLESLHPHVIQHLNIINAYSSINASEYHSRSEVENEFSKYVPDVSLRKFLLKNLGRDKENTFKWNINIDALKNNLPQILDGIEVKKANIDREKLNFQTLFIRGEKSNYILDADIIEIKNIFPKSEIITIFDSGHWVHSEKPELFLKSIKYFLEQ